LLFSFLNLMLKTAKNAIDELDTTDNEKLICRSIMALVSNENFPKLKTSGLNLFNEFLNFALKTARSSTINNAICLTISISKFCNLGGFESSLRNLFEISFSNEFQEKRALTSVELALMVSNQKDINNSTKDIFLLKSILLLTLVKPSERNQLNFNRCIAAFSYSELIQKANLENIKFLKELILPTCTKDRATKVFNFIQCLIQVDCQIAENFLNEVSNEMNEEDYEKAIYTLTKALLKNPEAIDKAYKLWLSATHIHTELQHVLVGTKFLKSLLNPKTPISNVEETAKKIRIIFEQVGLSIKVEKDFLIPKIKTKINKRIQKSIQWLDPLQQSGMMMIHNLKLAKDLLRYLKPPVEDVKEDQSQSIRDVKFDVTKLSTEPKSPKALETSSEAASISFRDRVVGLRTKIEEDLWNQEIAENAVEYSGVILSDSTPPQPELEALLLFVYKILKDPNIENEGLENKRKIVKLIVNAKNDYPLLIKQIWVKLHVLISSDYQLCRNILEGLNQCNDNFILPFIRIYVIDSAILTKKSSETRPEVRVRPFLNLSTFLKNVSEREKEEKYINDCAELIEKVWRQALPYLTPRSVIRIRKELSDHYISIKVNTKQSRQIIQACSFYYGEQGGSNLKINAIKILEAMVQLKIADIRSEELQKARNAFSRHMFEYGLIDATIAQASPQLQLGFLAPERAIPILNQEPESTGIFHDLYNVLSGRLSLITSGISRGVVVNMTSVFTRSALIDRKPAFHPSIMGLPAIVGIFTAYLKENSPIDLMNEVLSMLMGMGVTMVATDLKWMKDFGLTDTAPESSEAIAEMAALFTMALITTITRRLEKRRFSPTDYATFMMSIVGRMASKTILPKFL
jgi:hypothetical protein